MFRINRICILTIITFILISTPAYSAEKFDPLSSGIRMLWGLAVVLAIILLLYWLIKKNFKAFQQHDKGIIKVLEVKHVLPKKTLLLIEVKGQEYLVGAGSETIGTIVPLKQIKSFSKILDSSEEELSI